MPLDLPDQEAHQNREQATASLLQFWRARAGQEAPQAGPQPQGLKPHSHRRHHHSPWAARCHNKGRPTRTSTYRPSRHSTLPTHSQTSSLCESRKNNQSHSLTHDKVRYRQFPRMKCTHRLQATINTGPH